MASGSRIKEETKLEIKDLDLKLQGVSEKHPKIALFLIPNFL